MQKGLGDVSFVTGMTAGCNIYAGNLTFKLTVFKLSYLQIDSSLLKLLHFMAKIEICLVKIIYVSVEQCFDSALTLLVGRQEGHSACKKTE